jgi:hypothetical protein
MRSKRRWLFVTGARGPSRGPDIASLVRTTCTCRTPHRSHANLSRTATRRLSQDMNTRPASANLCGDPREVSWMWKKCLHRLCARAWSGCARSGSCVAEVGAVYLLRQCIWGKEWRLAFPWRSRGWWRSASHTQLRIDERVYVKIMWQALGCIRALRRASRLRTQDIRITCSIYWRPFNNGKALVKHDRR